MQRAEYYSKNEKGEVKCLLCPHGCVIPEGGRGICLARVVEGGELYADAYDQLCSFGTDPVEKKPLYHFYPGQNIFSIGSWGCNFKCSFCQNWQISQQEMHGREMPPDCLAEVAEGSIGVAYTYAEPYVNFEYVRDCCREVRAAGLKNVMVSNGYYNPEPLTELLEYVDAFNIDLKAFNNSFYREFCKGTIEPVLETLKAIAGKAHLEITTLLIPGQNDDPDDLAAQAEWIRDNCGAGTPLHLSGYFPSYKCDIPATSAQDLLDAAKICKEFLQHVYIGNISIADTQNTYCWKCGDLLVKREGYFTEIRGLDEKGRCISCEAENGFVL